MAVAGDLELAGRVLDAAWERAHLAEGGEVGGAVLGYVAGVGAEGGKRLFFIAPSCRSRSLVWAQRRVARMLAPLLKHNSTPSEVTAAACRSMRPRRQSACHACSSWRASPQAAMS